MEKALLKQLIIDQNPIDLAAASIPRTESQHIEPLMKSPQIVIIKGVRRSGKSTILQHIRQHSTEQNYYFNFDDDRLVQFTVEDFQQLYELFIEIYGAQKTFFFDEIQNILEWERFVRRLHNNGNKIYITGSNATMFSRELGTRLTGRYIAIEIYPFSFQEYLKYCQADNYKKTPRTTEINMQLKKYFNQFMTDGGLPEYLLSKQKDYLHTLYESIIYRDVIARYRLNDRVIKELVFYLASNIGKDVSFNALRKMLSLASASSVSDYCHYLEDSYLCFFLNRFDFSLKKQILYVKKVYFVDQALAKTVGFSFSEDRGRLLENIVFLELKRRYKEIYFHRQKKECDFLVRESGHITTALQVCVTVSNAETKKREISGLLEAMDMYDLNEGFILTESETAVEEVEYNHQSKTIKIIPIWQWLLFPDF